MRNTGREFGDKAKKDKQPTRYMDEQATAVDRWSSIPTESAGK